MFLRKIFHFWHKVIAALPIGLVRAYISVVSVFSRNLASEQLTTRIRNSVTSVTWKSLELAPLRARVGDDTQIKLVPHLGEFDADVLFTKFLGYEYPVFRWLERNCAERYQVVIEIGANVSIYTNFFHKTESDIRRWLSGKPFKTSVFTDHGLMENPLKAINDQRDWYIEHV